MIRKHLSALLSAATALLIFTGIAPVGIASAQESEPVEILSMRSEYEKHYDNGDGTITAFIDTTPLHYNVDGEWIDIDNTLVLDGSGNYVNKSNSMDITLAPSASVSALDAVDNEPLASIDYNGYSISWDFVNDQSETAIDASVEDISMPISYAAIEKEDDARRIDLGSNKLNKKASESVSKLSSSLSYDSLYENVDIDIDVMPSSVKETIILNERDNVPEQFSYYIKAEGLTAELYDDNSVHFLNEIDEDIFNIPAPYMFDSADIPENNYDIKVDIQEYEKGYLLTFIPDNDWIQSDERVYPVMIDPEVQVSNSNISVYNLSEARPNSVLHYNTFKVGGSLGDRYEAVISCPTLFDSIDASVITDAKLYVGFSQNTEMGKFDVYSFNQGCIPQWSACGDDNISSTYITSSTLPISYYYECPFDLTNLIQSWYNNKKTGGSVGLYMHYIKIALSTDSIYSGRIFEGGCNGNLSPYFTITYKKDSDYTLTYAPYKYNTYLNTDNFQNKMNCYAYALQTYYGGSGSYSLYPGEIGIGRTGNDNYNFTTKNDLLYKYNSYSDYLRTDILNNDTLSFLNNLNDYMIFIENQMRRDASEMGFDVVKYNSIINQSDSVFHRIFVNNNYANAFELPSNLEGRIIACIVYLSQNNFYNTYTASMHYYVRNGNGTCNKNGHPSTCSTWSHKMGLEEVTNMSKNGTVLCDCTLYDNAYDINNSSYINIHKHSSLINIYSITKDTDLFNSKFINDSNGEATIYYGK